jgi:spermidine synthase/MFS family permease
LRVPLISATASAAPSFGRIAWASLVVFLANAALLVLQLVAGRLLAPFIGSSLETWTAVIGVFLLGISLGNWLGGRLADRAADEGTLRWTLLLGAATTLAALGFLKLLGSGESLRWLPLGVRIPALTLVTCLPPSLVLSLITPVTIKLMLPDVRRTGRVVGLVYALGTLGSLAGNFLTGFVLLMTFGTGTITVGIAVLLAVCGIVSGWVKGTPAAATESPKPAAKVSAARKETPAPTVTAAPVLSIVAACTTVFIASFCSMALELGASRFLAPIVGVSLYSWTGIIGVVLAGIVLGNYTGGWIADRWPKHETLGNAFFLAGMFTMAALIIHIILNLPLEHWDKYGSVGEKAGKWIGELIKVLDEGELPKRIVLWAAILFFAPMFMLGTISPQVTRLAVSDWEHAGRVAGRIYAWSCAGAILGTFATGYGLISAMGVFNLIFFTSLLLILMSIVVGRSWERPAELFISAVIAGAALFGLYLGDSLDVKVKYDLETNYYAIKTSKAEYEGEDCRKLVLDHLIHSYVKGEEKLDEKGDVRKHPNGDDMFVADPSFLGYSHEQVQSEFARWAYDLANKQPHLLIIGGGGYTLPRWMERDLKGATVEVVEIDPGVTEIAHRKLGLPRDTKVITHHMDGRQFIQEKAERGHYQLVAQDAVNDLSVPYHIMTKEYNDAVKRLLTPDGVFLLTVIDEFEEGELMRAAVRTLKQSFAYVNVTAASPVWETGGRQVYVLYAADHPFDREGLRQALKRQGIEEARTVAMPEQAQDEYISKKPHIILTDSYAPVDNLMAVTFRNR